MARTITLKTPERFKDPANLTWERYVALQARERERYLAERATIAPEALSYRTVSPQYLERAVDQFANNYYSELSATHYVATAAANAPFDELKKCALFQLEDSIEILVKGNFVAEGAAGPGTFTVLADGAEARGDVLSAVNHRARIRDETRHISYGRALVKALIDDDPGNLAMIQQWQDESLRLFVEVARGGERQEWWEGFLASYYKIALPLGLRPTHF